MKNAFMFKESQSSMCVDVMRCLWVHENNIKYRIIEIKSIFILLLHCTLLRVQLTCFFIRTEQLQSPRVSFFGGS